MKKYLLALLCLLVTVPASANYLVMRVPSTSQIGTYNRPIEVARFPADKPFSMTWEYQDGTPSVDQVKLLVRGPDETTEFFTAPVTINSLKQATFTLTLPTGRYAIEPWGDGWKSTPIREAVVVGAPGPLESVLWACPSRFEYQYSVMQSSICAAMRLKDWPPKFRFFQTVLPTDLQPYPQTEMKAEDWAKLTYLYDLNGFGKSHRTLMHTPNDGGVTHVLGWYPTYFHSSIDGIRIPLTEGQPPIARFGHIIDAIPHPQGRGFYTAEVQGRIGLLETTGHFETFVGATTLDNDVPYYSELTLSNIKSDQDYVYKSRVWYGDYAAGVIKPLRRVWGMEMWPSPPPCDKGLHQGIIFDTFRHRLLYFDHRQQHKADNPECPGPGGQTLVKQIAGVYDEITRPCFDHPWMGRLDPLDKRTDKRWLYWTVRGGQPSSTDPKDTPQDPGRARICRAEVDLTTGELASTPEVYLESAYDQLSEQQTMLLAGGEFSGNAGVLKVQEKFPTMVDGKPGFILPNAMGFDSKGNLWFMEQCAQRMRVVDRTTKAVTYRAWAGRARTCYEITATMDTEGVMGPVDTVYGGTYSADSDFVIYPDGVTRRIVPWTGLTPSAKDISQGPFQQTTLGLTSNYQWGYFPGNKALPCMLVGQQAHGGAFLLCRRTAAQGLVDIARVERGLLAWRSQHGVYPAVFPAPALLGGAIGFNPLPAPAVGFPELATWDFADAREWLFKQGFTDTEAGDTIYAAKVQFAYKQIIPGTEMYPTVPADPSAAAPTLTAPPEYVP